MLRDKYNSSIPAQLWVGQHITLVAKLTRYFEKLFCRNAGCGVCRICVSIQEKQHSSIYWLMPDKQYKTEQIDELLHAMSFKLEENESFFFVIQRADLLTPATANRLLKSIEEPPAGYRFFLLSEQKELILPTIQSRCCIYMMHEKIVQQEQQELYGMFTDNNSVVSPAAFLLLMQKTPITDQETKTLFEKIVSFWVEETKKEVGRMRAMSIVHYLSSRYAYLPVSGGSKLFWMNLFLGLKL